MHGRLLITGIRGSGPEDPLFEADLEECEKAGVGGVILFDVDVPVMRDDDPLSAPRNILDEGQLRELTAHVRERLGPEAWISIDQEGGQVARLNERRGFDPDPSAVEFAALDPDARPKRPAPWPTGSADLGFDLNFAPCVDLALNPGARSSPVATGRSGPPRRSGRGRGGASRRACGRGGRRLPEALSRSRFERRRTRTTDSPTSPTPGDR